MFNNLADALESVGLSFAKNETNYMSIPNDSVATWRYRDSVIPEIEISVYRDNQGLFAQPVWRELFHYQDG